MESSYFPEDKDLAHKIMMELSNSDLVKICATNKRLYEICNNYPAFWRNKFVKDYGEHAAKYKPKNRSWKTHYMRVFIDLQKFKNDPTQFFDFFKNIAWRNNVDESYFIEENDKVKFVPLKKAPEWVMNNLYLLNIDNIEFTDLNGHLQEYINVTPIELLQKTGTISKDKYINGFGVGLDGLGPIELTLQDIIYNRDYRREAMPPSRYKSSMGKQNLYF